MLRERVPSALGAVLALVLAACGEGAGERETLPDDGQAEPVAMAHVVATTSILGGMVRDIAGDAARVDVLIDRGIDPHAFEPSAAQARLLREADLVVAIGLSLEESLVGVLAGAAADGVRVLELGEELDPIPFALSVSHDDDHGHDDDDDGHAHDDDDDHGHAHGDEDPHVWFDPVRMADGARLIAAALAEVSDALPPAEWAARGEAYAQQLLAVHDEIEALLAPVPPERRKLVTNHDALGYLAHRYGFEIVGAIIPGGGTLAEPGAGQFAALAQLIRDQGVPAIFAETTAPTRLADALAREAGVDVEVVVLYTESLGPPGSGAETYPDFLRANARLIADALA